MSMIDEQALRKELKLLKRRIRYAKNKGYNIDVEEIQRYIDRQNEEDVVDFIKSIRGNELRAYATGTTEDYDWTGDTNDEDFEPPEVTISPDRYSAIYLIEQNLLNFPPVIVIQIDVGVLGTIGKREWYDTEEWSTGIYEIFQKNVQEAKQLGSLDALEQYYEEEVQERLSELINNWTFNEYLTESEVLSEVTELMRLLNVGEALTASEMESMSSIFSFSDNTIDYKE